MKKTIKTFGLILITVFAILYISPYNYILSAVQKIYFNGHATAYLSDYTVFDNQLLLASTNPQPWPLHPQYNTIAPPEKLATLNKETGTIAFLIIKNDRLLYEKYEDGYGVNAKSNSFSMAKSFVSTLLGKAIMDGTIEGLDQKVKTILPELKGNYADEVTLGDLSSMASGLDWDESYHSPFSITTEAYFTPELRTLVLDQEINEAPGKSFTYKSGATQLLAIALEKAIGKSLSEYLQTNFWEPMGFESDALWQVDSKTSGMEKAFCCLASNARDFARIGKLYKNQGAWNGTQLLDSLFVSKVTQARFKESPQYGYSFWLKEYKNQKMFMMNGMLGQYVIVIPEKNLIIVRLGHSTKEPLIGNPFIEDLEIYLDATFEMTRGLEN